MSRVTWKKNKFGLSLRSGPNQSSITQPACPPSLPEQPTSNESAQEESDRPKQNTSSVSKTRMHTSRHSPARDLCTVRTAWHAWGSWIARARYRVTLGSMKTKVLQRFKNYDPSMVGEPALSLSNLRLPPEWDVAWVALRCVCHAAHALLSH